MNPTGLSGSTDYQYQYDKPYDNGYDYFLLFIVFMIAWLFIMNI